MHICRCSVTIHVHGGVVPPTRRGNRADGGSLTQIRHKAKNQHTRSSLLA